MVPLDRREPLVERERGAIQPHSLLVGQPPNGLVGRTHGPGPRGGRLAVRGQPRPVTRDVGEVFGQVVGEQLLQRLGDRPVQREQLRRGERRLDRVTGEHVDESVVPADAVHEAVPDRLVDGREQACDRIPPGGRDEREGELAADHRRGMQNAPAVGGDPIQPGPDDVEHSARRAVRAPRPSAIARATSRTKRGLPPVTSTTAAVDISLRPGASRESCSRTSSAPKDCSRCAPPQADSAARAASATTCPRARRRGTRRTRAGGCRRSGRRGGAGQEAMARRRDGCRRGRRAGRCVQPPFRWRRSRSRRAGSGSRATPPDPRTPLRDPRRGTGESDATARTRARLRPRSSGPQATAQSTASAIPARSWARLDLPIPASPGQSTTRPAPARAASSHRRSASSSRCRPTIPSCPTLASITVPVGSRKTPVGVSAEG